MPDLQCGVSMDGVLYKRFPLTCDFFLVTFENSELFHSANIEHSGKSILRSRGYAVAVWIPCHRLNSIFVIVPEKRVASDELSPLLSGMYPTL